LKPGTPTDTSNDVVFKDMFCPRIKLLSIFLLFFAVAAVPVMAADQAQSSQDSTNKATPATPSTAKETGGKPATPAASQASQAKPQQAAPGNGVVVFIDPSTGQIRQPDSSEIGTLVNPTNPAPKAPDTILLQGPGGAVGAVLGSDAMTYMVVTASPDGKLAMDCVNGEKAANARVAATAVQAAPAKETVKPQETQHSQNTQQPQETQNVKNQR